MSQIIIDNSIRHIGRMECTQCGKPVRGNVWVEMPEGKKQMCSIECATEFVSGPYNVVYGPKDVSFELRCLEDEAIVFLAGERN